MNQQYYVKSISATETLIIKMKETLSPLTEAPQMCTEESKFIFAKTCGWKNWEHMHSAHTAYNNTGRLIDNSVIIDSNLRAADFKTITKDVRSKLQAQLTLDFPELDEQKIHDAVMMVWPETPTPSPEDAETAPYMPSIYINDGIYVNTNIEGQYDKFIHKHILPTVAKNGGVVFCYEEQESEISKSIVLMGGSVNIIYLKGWGIKDALTQDNNNKVHIVVCNAIDHEEHILDEDACSALTEVIAHIRKTQTDLHKNKTLEKENVKTLLLPYNTEFIPKRFYELTASASLSGWGVVTGGYHQTKLTHCVEESYLPLEWRSHIENCQCFVYFTQKDKTLTTIFSKREFIPVLASIQHMVDEENIIKIHLS